MESAIISVIFGTIIRNLPLVVIFAIGIIFVIGYALKKYLQTSYVPIKIYEQDKLAKFEIIEHYKEELNNKSIKTHDDLMNEINKINEDLSLYVLKDVFDKEICSIEGIIDKLESKIDAIPERITESENRIIDMFLKMFKGCP